METWDGAEIRWIEDVRKPVILQRVINRRLLPHPPGVADAAGSILGLGGPVHRLSRMRREATVPSLASTLHAGVDRDSSSMAPGRLRATTHPPNPAPVMRAPKTPGRADQRGHQFIECRRGDLEVLGQAPMAFGHKRPGADQVVGQERVGTLAPPGGTR